MKANEFECAACHGIFEKNRDGWSEEAAKIEYEHKFPKSVEEEVPTLLACDDCYKIMMAQIPPDLYEKMEFGDF